MLCYAMGWPIMLCHIILKRAIIALASCAKTDDLVEGYKSEAMKSTPVSIVVVVSKLG